ncbi:amidohydrolase family protein [Maricaulis sp. CAU 1757]
MPACIREVRAGLLRAAVLCLLTSAMLAGHAFGECPAAPPVFLSPVHVVDVTSGEVRSDRALLLRDGVIAGEFAANTSPPSDSLQHDGRGRYAIPALTDMHVHALWAPGVPDAFLPAFLDAGVTRIRDMGGDLNIVATTRRRVLECDLEGPRILATGPFLDGPDPVDPSLSLALATPADAVASVRLLHREGVDLVKVYTLLSVDVLAAVLDEANALGLPVAGHLPAGVTLASPLAAQFQSIEHMAIERGGLCDGLESSRCSRAMTRLSDAGVAMTPTLVVRITSTKMALESFSPEGDLQVLPDVVRAYWQQQREATASMADGEWLEARFASLNDLQFHTRHYRASGGLILAGSDAGNPFVWPGQGLQAELLALEAAGLPPLAVLQAATINPALALNDPDSGVIAPGKRADIVLLDANPLVDIGALTQIDSVYLAGARIRGGD